MNNFTDKQILEIVKRYTQDDECVLDGEEKWCCEHIDYISYETDVEGKYVSYSTVYGVKGEKNKYVAVKAVKPIVAIDAYFVVPKEVTKIVYIKESND